MTASKYFAAMSLLLAACNDPVDPVQVEQEPLVAPATVVVAVDTVRAVLDRSTTPTYLQLNFPVAISNTSADTIRVTYCETWLQNERQGRWLTAGGGGCFLSHPPAPVVVIPPGETLQLSQRISVAYSGNGFEFGGTLPGRYRYKMGFLGSANFDFGSLGSKASNSFVVVLDD